MIETPQIVQTEEQQVACIHFVVPRERIMEVMGPGIREVFGALTAQGIAPAGPWLTHHRRPPTDTFDFKICVPVNTPVAPAGRVEAGVLPAAKVARMIYQGPYEALGDAWGELMEWIDDEGLDTAQDLWERYLVGPESGPDPANWRTELNRVLL